MARVWLGAIVAWMICAASLAWAEPPPIEAYGRFPAVSAMSLSPSGKRAAFLVTNQKGRLIVVQDVGGKILLTITPDQTKLRRISWAGDDFVLVTTSSTINLGMDWGFKHELDQVKVINLKSLKVLSVYQNEKAISNIVFGTYGVAQVNGRWYGYFGGLRLEVGDGGKSFLTNSNPQLYRVDLETGQSELAGPSAARRLKWVVASTGEVVAHSDYDEKSGSWRLLVGPGSGGRVVLSKSTPLEDIELIGQGRAPGTVLLVDRTGDEDALEEVSLTDGKTETLLGDYDVRGFIFDQVTHLFLGAEVRDPVGAVLFDPGRQARVRGAFKAFPNRHVELISQSPVFDELIVETEGDGDSGTYWFVDIAKGTAIPLGGARPDVPAEAVGSSRMFAYKAADGLGLEGVLILPAGNAPKNLPLVVMPHGGPMGERNDPGFDWWAQAFASRGYAVFQPNYRGSGGYGLSFYKAGYGEWGRKMLSDMSDGVTALVAQGTVDPKRVCIVGASYGGYAALAGVTLQHGFYRCAVSYAGLSDLPDWRRWQQDREGYDNALSRSWNTVVKGDTKDALPLDRISPARAAAKAEAPILLMHGKDDTVVPIDQSRKMAAALKGSGKSVEIDEFPGQDHWLDDETSRIQIVKASVDFVEKYDPPN